MSRYNTRKQRWVKRLLPKGQQDKYQAKIDQELIVEWEKSGKPSPPPHAVKVRTVETFQQKTNIKTLVETGTFMGDMILSQLHNFDQIYSIELSEKFWKQAKELFKDQSHVHLLQGDSGVKMQELVDTLAEPAIFWLDGHYSGEGTAKGEKLSPIYGELKAIFSSSLQHCLLIDDARLFNGTEDYPTLEELKTFILENRSNATIQIEADTISVLY